MASCKGRRIDQLPGAHGRGHQHAQHHDGGGRGDVAPASRDLGTGAGGVGFLQGAKSLERVAVLLRHRQEFLVDALARGVNLTAVALGLDLFVELEHAFAQRLDLGQLGPVGC
jgi:hypothetical protein